MGFVTDYQYYTNASNHGSYQYITLDEIVTNFLLMKMGNTSLINNEERYKVVWHAKRAIQELNYDALKEVRVLQLEVCDGLMYVLPPDYVNWVRISLYKDGVLRPLSENIQTNFAQAYLQDSNCNILFDEYGNIARPEYSGLDLDRIRHMDKGIYLNANSPYNGYEGFYHDGNWYFEQQVGARYGLNTETANSNPTFRIDKKSGVINFSSDMMGESCVLEYITDGMEGNDNSKISVNKMFERYVYAYIKYELLNDKLGVQEYVVNRARKEMMALLRNAKIRMSNLHPGRLLMNLRGQNKILK